MFSTNDDNAQKKGKRRARLLRELPGALIAVSEVDDLLRLTARNVMDALDYEDCVIYLLAEDGMFEQRAAWGPKTVDGLVIDNPLRLTPDQGIVGAAATSQQPQIIANAAADPRYVADLNPVGSELAVPIVFRGRSLGVIDSEHSELDFYSEDDAEIVGAIANIVAAMLEAVMTAEQLTHTVEELRQAKHELEVVARTDLLTGVGNRRYLQDVLRSASHGPHPYGVAAIGIDGLKRVNQRHGEPTGDKVIQAVASSLADACTSLGVTLCRGASDEFFIVASLPMLDFTSRISEMLTQLANLRHGDLDPRDRVTASAGVAHGIGGSILNDASDALAVGKQHGGNNVWIYSDDDNHVIELRNDRTWGPRIERALQSNELCLVTQVVAGSVDNQPEFFEVLLRHRSPNGILTTPIDLLDAANRLGRGPSVDNWVTSHVIDALEATDPHMRFSVNWTVDSITSPSMVRQLVTALEQADIDPTRLVIEVTEHACISAPIAFRHGVAGLRTSGVLVALDDLGAGWTSLRTLEQTPVDYIKLDGDWVRSAVHNDLARIAVRSMVDCASALDTQVVAEWVENDEIRDLVRGLGVAFVQGYGIERPRPIAELLGELNRTRQLA